MGNENETNDLVDGRLERQPEYDRTLRLTNAMSCARELYDSGEMTKNACKAVAVHFIELAGYDPIFKDF